MRIVLNGSAHVERTTTTVGGDPPMFTCLHQGITDHHGMRHYYRITVAGFGDRWNGSGYRQTD
ncbi:unnamed protein product [Soboliphyme baturini]|uniref:Fibronectin type-III domain-containing protein n=1 Tax=Soboliphyme baturini TaxID=241478 RepID=A0A183J5E3_9BILA|nr:unnamed protein product [Soboliphyme baturini]